MRYIDVPVTAEMLDFARGAEEEVRVHRTRASQIDSLTGLVGELAFAQWFLGDWKAHNVRDTKGRPDLLGKIEVKTSAYPFSERLNLLVREDYAQKRRPEFYVQVIVDTPDRNAQDILAGWNCRLSGWAAPEEVDSAPLKDFGAKGGGRGGYQCHFIAIKDLRPMESFPSLASFQTVDQEGA